MATLKLNISPETKRALQAFAIARGDVYEDLAVECIKEGLEILKTGLTYQETFEAEIKELIDENTSLKRQLREANR